MGLLTPDQVRELRDYLERHGLTYELLQTEMLDHICCDVEINMEKGLGFEEAIKKVTSEIPKNQFKKIQTETMEVANKTIKTSTRLTYVSFSALILATLFKLMHWPGAAQLLITSFVILALTLVVGSFNNPMIRKKNSGTGVLVVLVIAVMAYLASLCFQLLHIRGDDLLRSFSVSSYIITLSGYAIRHYLYPEVVSRHIILDYVKKEAWNIEKALLVLFVFGVSLKLWQNDFVSIVYFMMFFAFGAGFYSIKCWPFFSEKVEKPGFRIALLAISIVAYSLFMLPTLLHVIDVPTRILMIWSSSILVSLTIAVYYVFHSDDIHNYLLGFFSFLLAVVSTLNLTGKYFLQSTDLGASLISTA
ncbi:MAG: hypothetical protein ACJA2S_003167 [Cyclobacteriaceae bacterium]|jgi:hypothetical protein